MNATKGFEIVFVEGTHMTFLYVLGKNKEIIILLRRRACMCLLNRTVVVF